MDEKRTEQLIRDTRYKIYLTINSARKSELVLSDMLHDYFESEGYILDGFADAKCRCEIVDNYLRETLENLKELHERLENYISLSKEKDGAENEANT